MGTLAYGVYPCIRPPSAVNGYLLSCSLFNSLFNGALYGYGIVLALPSRIIGSIVFYNQFYLQSINTLSQNPTSLPLVSLCYFMKACIRLFFSLWATFRFLGPSLILCYIDYLTFYMMLILPKSAIIMVYSRQVNAMSAAMIPKAT